MIPGGGGEDGRAVLQKIDQMLQDPAAVLKVSGDDLLGLIDPRQVRIWVEEALGDKPSTIDGLRHSIYIPTSKPKQTFADHFDIGPSPGAVQWFFSMLSFEAKRAKYHERRNTILRLLKAISITRQAVTLTDKEKALLRGMAAMLADGGLPISDWCAFYALAAYADGAGRLEISTGRASNSFVGDAEKLFRVIVKLGLPTYEQRLAAATAQLSAYRANSEGLSRLVSESLNQGARWLDAADVPTSRLFSFAPTASALNIGDLGHGRPLYFNGNESLITFGGPGSGKTQGQVIPNLLAYPGSAFVLDVKGELFEATAQARKAFGPVYRFAPTDERGASHHYNPFDGISTDPARAAIECRQLAAELVPENPDARDPYWERKARDFVWAFAMATALEAAPENRNLTEVSRYLAIPTYFAEKDATAYKRSVTFHTTIKLKALAEVTGLTELATAATAIDNGVAATRLESVFDMARTHISSITRVPSAAAALAASDWSPNVLRERPGTTVYLCLKPGDVRAFGPLVRLIFAQHITALTRDFTRRTDTPPVTFFLDEMPQLGFMPGLSDIIDIGRGAGLRLWMFAQYLGQVREIYGTRADGLINACAVRCFMQPDLEVARFISPQLGTTQNVFTGEKKPLAEPHDLMGRAYADKTIVLGRSEHPARLDKQFAFERPLKPVAA